jgi:glyoxylase-like metal-dependent hydrolase (beta-lactamase superfamily II)
MSIKIKTLEELLPNPETLADPQWQVRAIQSEECMSYVAWNSRTKEAIIVDPKLGCQDAYAKLVEELKGYCWLAVFDTHTHADHISSAADLAMYVNAPLVMSEKAPSRRVNLRVSGKTLLPNLAASIIFVPTPGHTNDGMTIFWGPYIFGGDTLLYGDTGRDDLPTGDPEAHYESLQKIKEVARAGMFLLPGHDHKGGRASSWEKQLQLNSSLTQDRDTFVREAAAFTSAAPRLLKESLLENFK